MYRTSNNEKLSSHKSSKQHSASFSTFASYFSKYRFVEILKVQSTSTVQTSEAM